MLRDDLILSHIPVARKIARRLSRTLHGDYEEFESAAYLGLVEAATRYDPMKNDNFERWADTRIRGAIYDYLRLQSRLPKDERTKRKEDPERVHTGPVFHTKQVGEDAIEDIPGPVRDPIEALSRRDVRALLAQLSEHHRRVMQLYYFDRLTDPRIGAQLGCTASRVCQIRQETCARIRATLHERGIAFDDVW